jgi:hypothetical protein
VEVAVQAVEDAMVDEVVEGVVYHQEANRVFKTLRARRLALRTKQTLLQQQQQ